MENVRIDKGIERGAKHEHTVPERKPDGQSLVIPANLDPDEILQRYLVEQSTSNIAESYGIRRRALTRWLRTVRPKEWKEVQEIRALATKEDGTELLYDAATALDLARGRELLRAGQWELERLDSNYAIKQEVSMNINLDLGEKLRRAKERVIDVTPQQLPSDAQSGVQVDAIPLISNDMKS